MRFQHGLFVAGVINLALAAAAFGAEDSPLKRATFCHGLEENQSPKGEAKSFTETETVYLSVELKGRPKAGVVSAKFMFRDSLIAEGKVDVATANKGVLFSLGQSTFAGFNLTHASPLPVGDCYAAVVSFDGKALGTFPFRIAPPKEAIPSKIKSVTLARSVDKNRKPVDETREFSPQDDVILAGVGDLGLSSWIEATWTVGGKVDDAGTRSLTMQENKADVPFTFTFHPAGDWPAGIHEVALQLDGKEVAREKFTVKPGAPMAAAASKLEVTSCHLLRDDGNGEAGKEVEAFETSDLILHARWKLKARAQAKDIQFVWILVEAAGEKNQTIATADLNAGLNDSLTTTLTTKKGLPAGKYRVELMQDGRLLDSKAFEVK